MVTLIQISPIIIVFTMLLILRKPPIQAVIVGSLVVGLLWWLNFGTPVDRDVFYDIILDTTVLFLSTSAVIAPGLAFITLTERMRTNAHMAQWLLGLG